MIYARRDIPSAMMQNTDTFQLSDIVKFSRYRSVREMEYPLSEAETHRI